MTGIPQDDYTDDDGINICRHNQISHLCKQCEAEFQELADVNGGIEKCLNCGKIKWGDQLNEHQVCSKGCVNPNEY